MKMMDLDFSWCWLILNLSITTICIIVLVYKSPVVITHVNNNDDGIGDDKENGEDSDGDII